MRVLISAEPFEPKIVWSDNGAVWLVEFGDPRLSSKTWDELKVWHDKYQPYTDIKDESDLLKHKSLIEFLDNEGLKLTRKVAKEWQDLKIERFVYFSYGFYFLVSIDSEGKEVKIENPTEDDWTKC